MPVGTEATFTPQCSCVSPGGTQNSPSFPRRRLPSKHRLEESRGIEPPSALHRWPGFQDRFAPLSATLRFKEPCFLARPPVVSPSLRCCPLAPPGRFTVVAFRRSLRRLSLPWCALTLPGLTVAAHLAVPFARLPPTWRAVAALVSGVFRALVKSEYQILSASQQVF